MITRMQEKTSTRSNRLVTLMAASEELGVPYTSMRDLVIRGFLPRMRLGDSKRIWVSREAIERLMTQSEERIR